MQSVVVSVIVACCVVYAGWSLAPAAWRRALASNLLRFAWPARFNRWLQKHATVTSGCACDGCDRNTSAAKATSLPSASPTRPASVQPITFHPRQNPRQKPPASA